MVASWSDKHTAAFEAVKAAVREHTHLSSPDFEKEFWVHTDASDTHIACSLSQEHGPIAFHGRRMTPAEQKMGAYDREAISIHHAYTVWRAYLEGSKSVCFTDHCPLTYLLEQTNLTRRQARILLYLQSFETDI